MAGYSGARKVIAPGVAHEDTIRTCERARFMEDPAAIQCNVDRNPLHEEQLEIVSMFGEVIESHLAAVAYVAHRGHGQIAHS